MSKFFKNGTIHGDELFYHENGQKAFIKHWDEGIEIADGNIIMITDN